MVKSCVFVLAGARAACAAASNDPARQRARPAARQARNEETLRLGFHARGKIGNSSNRDQLLTGK